jgi:hypothetical protein
VKRVARPLRRRLQVEAHAKASECATSSRVESLPLAHDRLKVIDQQGTDRPALNWSVVQEFTDHAISGATLLRSGFQALMRDALNRRFDIVLAESLDRFSRDQEDTAGLFKRLTFAGVSIVTLAEGDITHPHIGFKGTMNALFLKDWPRDAPGTAWQGGSRQGWRGTLLRLPCCAHDDRDDGVHRRARD